MPREPTWFAQHHTASGCCVPKLVHSTLAGKIGSMPHGIFQARALEWGAIAFSRDKLNRDKSRKIFKCAHQSLCFLNSHKDTSFEGRREQCYEVVTSPQDEL